MNRNYFESKVHRFPSQEFGEKTGLHFLYKEWKLPKDESSMMVDVIDRGGFEVYKDILALNADISLDITDEMIEGYRNDTNYGELGSDIYFHVCYGFVSRFTLEDIQFFLNKSYGNQVKLNTEYRIYKDKLESDIGMTLSWATSYTTMERVRKELKK